MARRTVRIDIPTGKPDALIQLAKDIQKQHDKLATAGTPDDLDDAGVQALAAKAADAAAKRAKAKELDAQAESLRQQAATVLGIAPGQAASNAGTVLFAVTGFRDELLTEHRGNEEALGEYGFNVVTGTAAAPKRKPKG